MQREAAAEAIRRQRRGFFQEGVKQMQATSAEVLRSVGEAADVVRDVIDSLEEPELRSLWQETQPRPQPARIAPPRPKAVRPVIRPPGARPEAAFLTLCGTCHACVEACEPEAIIAAPAESRAGREGTPMLRVHYVPCDLCVDVPCASACPTGALQPLAVAEINLGTAVVFRDLCLNGLGDSCDICVDQCPIGPTALTMGEDGFPVVFDAACTGCGQCVRHCPTYPVALHVVPA
ncbi:MAG: ferredoxin-type protein NapG [Myxococcota bacterium]